MQNDSSTLAPIVLFVYNRPWHTQQILEALAKNRLADQSVLYIYADGAKEDTDEDNLIKIRETRKILRQQKWCGEVHIIQSEKNKGLAKSIIEGVTEIIDRHGKVIVLEDDIVTSLGFLQYMNDALYLYENEDKVMHISAFTPVTTGNERLPETYFLRFMSCWGWATWKTAWNKLIVDTDYLYNCIPKLADYEKYNLDGYKNMFSQLEDNKNGVLNTWAIKWYSSIFINKGLCLYPRKSLMRNIGFDGSGINCGNDHISAGQHNSLELADDINVKRIKIIQNRYGYNYLKRYYRYGEDSSLKMRLLYWIDRTVILKDIYSIYFKLKRLI